MNNKKLLQKNEIDNIISNAKQLVPWWNFSFAENALKIFTEEQPNHFLNGFYLFPLNEISINSEIQDVSNYINERFQIILSAASASNISVMLIINSRHGKNSLYLGFRKDDIKTSEPELFDSIINGIIPGKRIKFDEKVIVSSLTTGFEYGGVVTGIPTIKIDDEKQKFDISSIIRALYGKEYTLSIISKPLNNESKQEIFRKIISIQDELHAIAKRTIGEEKGKVLSKSESEQTTKGSAKSSGKNFGASPGGVGGVLGVAFGGPIGGILGYMLGSSTNYSKNFSNTYSESQTIGLARTTSEQRSFSISSEVQNGSALELEKVANEYLKRIIRGFNSGLWETYITFAANDRTTCEIIGGCFIGELSKPNDSLLCPPRFYVDKLSKEQTLFIPKVTFENSIFPKILASYITSEELALISSPPKLSIPGFEIKKMPSLALNDSSEGEYKIGNITDHGNPIEASFLMISKNDLNKHLFVCGITGSGKTTTVKHILKELRKDKIPFLVLESVKRDYRQMLADKDFKGELKVFTIGDATICPLSFNPFYVQKGVHPLVHIDYLKAIFNASFSLYGPMPHIVEKCLHNIYLKKGWDLNTGIHPYFLNDRGILNEERYNMVEHFYLFPTLEDLKNEVDDYIKSQLEYKGELKDNIRTAILTRLESLCIGAKGLLFNTYDFYPIEHILKQNIIFEMENLADDDDKAFFVGLILVLISEYRQKDNPAIHPGKVSRGLKHFLVIEEAHRLLKNVAIEKTSEMFGNPKGKAVEVFCNVISEMRSLGQGVAVVEQIPSKISPDVIKNTNTKIVHRLVSKDDQILLTGALSISDEEALYLNRLNTGYALCHKEGMEKPVECSIINDIKSHAISDSKIWQIMRDEEFNSLHFLETYQLSKSLNKEGKKTVIKFMDSLFTIDFSILEQLIEKTLGEFKKIIILKINHKRYDDDVLVDFLVKQIFELLTSGVFCRTFKLPENFKNNISELLLKPTINKYNEIIELFKEVWNTPHPKHFIIEVVTNLSLRFIFENKLYYNDIESVVLSFFLLYNPSVIEEIMKNVLNLIDGKK